MDDNKRIYKDIEQESQNGFTLVELSIVIVIIGLLISGILVAQSLIESAKVRRFTQEVMSYDMALMQFRAQYKNEVPGDSTKFSPAGNGDGALRNSNNGSSQYWGEIGNYWKHLQQVTKFAAAQTAFRSPAGTFNTLPRTLDTPVIKLDAESGVVVSNCYSNSGSFWCGGVLGTHAMAYFFADMKGFTAAVWRPNGKPIAKPALAFAIDAKLDDGLALNGTVQARNMHLPSDIAVNGGDCTNYNSGTWTNGSGTNYLTATYIVDNNNIACHLTVGLLTVINIRP